MMAHYARIEDGTVAELFDTDGDIAMMFHPDLQWVQAPEDVQLGWMFGGSEFSASVMTPPPVAVPQSVTAAQGGIALIQAGLMDAVQAAADASDTPAEVKWAWERAQTWERDSAALAYLAGKAGITSEQMDALFIAAAKIQA